MDFLSHKTSNSLKVTMKCGLYLYTSCIVIQIFCLLTVGSVSVDVPLVSRDPCGLPDDITVWFETSSRQEKINQFYVKINRNIPANSIVKASFDAEVNIFMDGKDKWTSIFVRAGDSMEKLFPMKQAGFSFIVRGTATGRANLTSLTIGGVELCDKFMQISQSQRDTVSRKRSKPNLQCGRRIIHSQGITDPISGSYLPRDNGSVVDGLAGPGHWPWHVAVYRLNRQKTQFNFLCGGTLVSNNFVVTAAHCVGVTTRHEKAEHVLVEFGQYSLTNRYNYSLYKENVAEIIVHENYNHTRETNDIALLKLKSKVQFTDFIRPACLWDRRRAETMNISSSGVLAGWGYTDNNFWSPPLQQVNLPLVSDETCIESYPEIYSLYLNGKNFCAGFAGWLAGPTPCGGDDGGAVQVFAPDAINDKGEFTSGTWYVRGLMSFYLTDNKQNNLLCAANYSTYAVFTDVEKYSEWISSFLDDDSPE